MKRITTIALVLLLWIATKTQAQVDNVGVYAFAHSLIDHAGPLEPTPSNETTIFHWMNEISSEAAKTFYAGGQFGFLINHANLPPSSSLFYERVMPVWDQEVESFKDSRINTILLTAANFIQYTPADGPYPLEESTTVQTLTETIFDWVDHEVEARYYIYLNWPEMDLQSAYPPTVPLQSEIDAYHNTTINDFTEWWKEYQDLIISSRPEYNARLIPVGTILSKIMSELIPGEVPFEAYYDDSAPHGKPTLYFLAGMITYMAIYAEEIPSSYMPYSIVHEGVRNNLAAINDFIWQELLDFNFANGESRVFYPVPTTTLESTKNETAIFPNPTSGTFSIIGLGDNQSLKVLDLIGNTINTTWDSESSLFSIKNAPKGIYFVEIRNADGSLSQSKSLIKID